MNHTLTWMICQLQSTINLAERLFCTQRRYERMDVMFVCFVGAMAGVYFGGAKMGLPIASLFNRMLTIHPSVLHVHVSTSTS